MKLNTYLRRALSWGLSLLICAAGLAQPALAADRDTVRPMDKLPEKCSLTLEYPRAGMNIELYRVAGVNERVVFNPRDGAFEAILNNLNENLNAPKTAGGWRELANSLNGQLPGRNIKPVSTVTQSVGGKIIAQFTDLKPGLYLVKNQKYIETREINGKLTTFTYNPAPYLVCLPNWMEENGTYSWVADVEADFRGKVIPNETQVDKTIPLRVVKVWLDEGGRPLNSHPGSIKVELWRDDRLEETVTLSQSNGWSYLWPELDASSEWNVREADSGKYLMKISSNDGINIRITNTLPSSDPDPSDPSDPPKPSDPPDSSNPSNDWQDPPPEEFELDDPLTPLAPPPLDDPSEEYEEIEIDDPDVPLAALPQTGQLWWPVPLLAIGGVFLFLIGWVQRRRMQDEE